MLHDLLFDTHVLNEFIAQYYENKIYSEGKCQISGVLTKPRVKKINVIVEEYKQERTFSNGIIVTSVFSFIEIARKFSVISASRYSVLQFKSFIDQPPPYLHIAPVEKEIGLFLNNVPRYVTTKSGVQRPIELPDAIHCATYFSRDSAYILTDDENIRSIKNIQVL